MKDLVTITLQHLREEGLFIVAPSISTPPAKAKQKHAVLATYFNLSLKSFIIYQTLKTVSEPKTIENIKKKKTGLVLFKQEKKTNIGISLSLYFQVELKTHPNLICFSEIFS